MGTRAARLARGWVVGTFATLVAAASHAIAGGGVPSPLAIAVALMFAGMLGTLAMGRRPSLLRLVIAAGGAQLAFHSVFALLSTAPGLASGTGHPHAPVILPVTGAGHGTDPTMWFGHAVAAVATVAFLAHAERAVWGLLRDILARIAPLARPVVVARSVRTESTGFDGVPHSRDLATVLTRRGPPDLRFG